MNGVRGGVGVLALVHVAHFVQRGERLHRRSLHRRHPDGVSAQRRPIGALDRVRVCVSYGATTNQSVVISCKNPVPRNFVQRTPSQGRLTESKVQRTLQQVQETRGANTSALLTKQCAIIEQKTSENGENGETLYLKKRPAF